MRLRVFDRFGNPREATTTLTPNGQEGRPPFPGNESIVSRAPTNAGVRNIRFYDNYFDSVRAAREAFAAARVH